MLITLYSGLKKKNDVECKEDQVNDNQFHKWLSILHQNSPRKSNIGNYRWNKVAWLCTDPWLEISPEHRSHDQKAYARMLILQKLYSFNVSVEDLVHMNIIYIQSVVEQNVAVWNHTITQEKEEDIELVQTLHLK